LPIDYCRYVIVLIICFNSIQLNSQKSTSSDLEYLKASSFEKTIENCKNELRFAKGLVIPNIHILMGEAFEGLNQADSAFHQYNKALKIFEDNQLDQEVALLSLRIYELIDAQKNLKLDNERYWSKFYSYAKISESDELLAKAYKILGIKNLSNSNEGISIDYFLKALELYKKSDKIIEQVKMLSNIGAVYNKSSIKRDSARYFYQKALLTLDADTLKFPNLLFGLYNNIGTSFRKDSLYQDAIIYYKKADCVPLDSFLLKSKRIVYYNIQSSYAALGDFKNAHTYFVKYDSVNDELKSEVQDINITKIEEKYQNEKLRADNLKVKNKEQRTRGILIASVSILLFTVLALILIQKNIQKKKKLVEKEKEIQQQKLTANLKEQELEKQKIVNALKEQEIKTMDALIEGQEKERQRIADDLHDDLGAQMANLKAHFDILKEQRVETLFDKIDDLLKQAHLKIRSLAHFKYAGVMANQGLLKAVKNMANKASILNKINIEVVDHGLEQKLENSVELVLFRIIQELIANIIKHSGAKEAAVHLVNHTDNLNIIVEDDGIGFNTDKLKKNKTMGIHNIERRITLLDGTFSIESTINKGTTVIINIPI